MKEAGMDPNPFSNPPLGYILFGLMTILFLAAVIYGLGAWGAMKMRQGRIEDSTAIPYSDNPRSEDDRETVRRAQAKGPAEERIATEEQLKERALGADRTIVPQTPTRGERPVDAADRDKEAHQIGSQAGASSPDRVQRGKDKQSSL